MPEQDGGYFFGSTPARDGIERIGKMKTTLFLVGARASGKTTIGRALAQALGYSFVDTDRYIQDAGCMTVAEIVEREGWDGFRHRESAALRAVAVPDTVVATGGGMVLSEDNRAYMWNHGMVFFLSVPVEVLASRLQADPNNAQRPTLTGRTIVDEVREVLAARERLYREAAHYVLDGTLPVDAVVRQALEALQRKCHGHIGRPLND